VKTKSWWVSLLGTGFAPSGDGYDKQSYRRVRFKGFEFVGN